MVIDASALNYHHFPFLIENFHQPSAIDFSRKKILDGRKMIIDASALNKHHSPFLIEHSGSQKTISHLSFY